MILETQRLVPLDRRGRDVDRFRSAEHRVQPRQAGALQIAKTLLTVVRVVGDDERADVVVRNVTGEDDRPAERVRDALLEELRSVRAVSEIGRLANRAIAGDKLDLPILGLAILAVGVAIRALKNASRSPAAAAHIPASLTDRQANIPASGLPVRFPGRSKSNLKKCV